MGAASSGGVVDAGFVTPVPTRWVGPLRISGENVCGEVRVPLATYEVPLWPSVGRGASVSREVPEGIRTVVTGERMTRSVLFTADSSLAVAGLARVLPERFQELADVVAAGSRHARLLEVHPEVVGNLLFVRFAFVTGDASGHNMVTAAADQLMARILSWGFAVSYGSVSGNFCTDKKASAVNGVRGRGRSVVAEILLPEEVVSRRLRSSAERIAQLNVQKNLVGSVIAGSVRSANAHYANMLLACFLATGQDAANIVEGSQGFTYCEAREGDLFFSCTLPHLIVGSVGNGKHLPHVREALGVLGCLDVRESGVNALRLAEIFAATVLCGELSLLAAQTNPGELMATHVNLERER